MNKIHTDILIDEIWQGGGYATKRPLKNEREVHKHEWEMGESWADIKPAVNGMKSGRLVGPVSRKNDRKDGKARWELLPLMTVEEIVKVYTYGAEKYGCNTWQNLENGYERYKAALLRHIVAFEKGDTHDCESGIHSLAHAAWNAIAMLHLAINKRYDESQEEETLAADDEEEIEYSRRTRTINKDGKTED